MTTTEHAKELRNEFKARGWMAKDVSVVTDYYSLGSTIRVRIKSDRVNLEEAKALAYRHEDVRRCEQTGEILGGGNRYVSITNAGGRML